ncbi:glycerophosphodiester phosphodiesterase [Maioricimonas sp. JC845]|uniref:glycerophosphodiester phosphodiesterase n=1 Tax=Maioricimonas sp. JC845 TaxID=3232138 RepID=UPI003459507D
MNIVFRCHCLRRAAASLTLLFLTSTLSMASDQPVVIAHRGASGYLPEHTLEAKAMAHAMGADYLEQDVVLTKDGIPVVLHDIHLDTVTDVRDRFPDRHRDDGRYYAIDFTLEEIRTLNASERFSHKTGRAVYPKRFPAHSSRFEVPTLAEELELIQGLNRSTGRTAGIYPEIKQPGWHRSEGQDISRIVLDVLHKYGYRTKDDPIFLQCFEEDELRRIREELGAEFRLVQLVSDRSTVGKAATATPPDLDTLNRELKRFAEFADGIGPALPAIIPGVDDSGAPRVTPLVERAHAHGLVVHPWTFRSDAMPAFCDDMDTLLGWHLNAAKIDGLFTDFPDQPVRFLKSSRNGSAPRSE